jgi:hypothetical protein
MISPIPIRRRQRRYNAKRSPPAAPGPAALTLVTATYGPSGLTLTLAFDRAIDIDGFDPGQVAVSDGDYRRALMSGTDPATLTDAMTVEVPLGAGLLIDSGPVVMNATATTGIVAVDDGGTWAGGTGLDVVVSG